MKDMPTEEAQAIIQSMLPHPQGEAKWDCGCHAKDTRSGLFFKACDPGKTDCSISGFLRGVIIGKRLQDRQPHP